MNRRTFFRGSLLTLAAVSALGLGCVRWTIVHQAAPNPLVGAKFALEPVHWEKTMVGAKNEAEYFADKGPDQQQSYATDKVETTSLFAARIKTAGVQWVNPGDPQAFIVRPIVDQWEPGFYAAVVAKHSRMDLRLQILTAQGQLVDEITIWSQAHATMTSPSSGQRMRTCGDDLGNVAAKYLAQRSGG